MKGLNYPENRFKYNGIEQIGDLGLEDYDAKFRELDPQIGRWWQIDPKTEEMEMWSPYASNYDNPIRYNDVLGDEPDQRGSPRPGPMLLTAATLELLNKVWQVSASTTLGAANAYLSDNLLGVGRIDASKTGLKGGNATAYQVGQKLGDAAAVYTGVLEDAAAGVGEFFSFGGATAVAVPVAIHGTITLGLGLQNLFSNPIKKVENRKKGPKDLVQEAKEAKAKEAAAKERELKRESATQQGKNKTGNSNKDVRGSHDKNASKAKKNDHEAADTRRAREQKAADEKKKKN